MLGQVASMQRSEIRADIGAATDFASLHPGYGNYASVARRIKAHSPVMRAIG